MAKLRMRQAIVKALDDALAEDPNVILLGEDIAAAGGAFKCTEGLLDKYGSNRVIDTPISEMAFLGAAVGAAARGLRPVVEMMFVEFIGVALDQLTTEASTIRYLSRGQMTAPLVVRASVGGGQGFGCQHSQVLDHLFRGTPGIKVCMPSDARTAYGLMRSAIDDPDPVVVLEPRILYGDRTEFDVDSSFRVPLGHAEVTRAGLDVTLVVAGAMVPTAMAAADLCNADIEVVNLLSLTPWDREEIVRSVQKTGGLVTLEESTSGSGWGGDVVSSVISELFSEMKSPPLRITLPPAPIPYNAALEARFFPTPEYVSNQIDELLLDRKCPKSWWETE